MSDVKHQIRQYFEANFLLVAGARMPADSDSFIDYHLLDSTGFLELVTFIEDQFVITVDDGEMIPENLDSFDALTAFVTRKLSALPAT